MQQQEDKTYEDILARVQPPELSDVIKDQLSVTVRFLSGTTQVFQGFMYDDLASVLESQVLSWVSTDRGIDEAWIKVLLRRGERVIDTKQTLRKNEITDGMEISVMVADDPPPPLVWSSDEDIGPQQEVPFDL